MLFAKESKEIRKFKKTEDVIDVSLIENNTGSSFESSIILAENKQFLNNFLGHFSQLC